MHNKTLIEYIRDRSSLGSKMDERARPDKFYVFGMSGPDTFQELKHYIMAYFEDSGYRCDKETPSFQPSARELRYRNSENKIAITVTVKHELFGNEREIGRAQVIVKRRRSVK